MRKRLVSSALAVLLAMSLGIPAFADAAEEEDFFATALDLARYLEQASGVVSVSYVELSGTIDAGGEETDVDVELDYAESAYQDGYRLTMAEYEAYDPVENYQAAAVVADSGEVYFVTASDIEEEELSLARYEAVPEDAFSDMSRLSAYFAALDGRVTDAAVRNGVLAYEAAGAEVRELLAICCPKLTEGFEDLDWDSATARVRVEFFEAPFGASVEITSSQLGEAMLRSLDGDGTVTDAEFTAELDILGAEEDEDEYDDYRITARDITEEAQTEGIEIEDREGECPACGTAEDFLRTVYASARSTR